MRQERISKAVGRDRRPAPFLLDPDGRPPGRSGSRAVEMEIGPADDFDLATATEPSGDASTPDSTGPIFRACRRPRKIDKERAEDMSFCDVSGWWSRRRPRAGSGLGSGSESGAFPEAGSRSWRQA